MQEGKFTYYNWDGLPCRIKHGANGSLDMEAELYRPGKGFISVRPIEVIHESTCLTKNEFDDMVLRMTRLGSK